MNEAILFIEPFRNLTSISYDLTDLSTMIALFLSYPAINFAPSRILPILADIPTLVIVITRQDLQSFQTNRQV